MEFVMHYRFGSLFFDIKHLGGYMLTHHHYRIIKELKSGWRSQLEMANLGLSRTLSKRVCEINMHIQEIGLKVAKRWVTENGSTFKQYRIVKKEVAKVTY